MGSQGRGAALDGDIQLSPGPVEMTAEPRGGSRTAAHRKGSPKGPKQSLDANTLGPQEGLKPPQSWGYSGDNFPSASVPGPCSDYHNNRRCRLAPIRPWEEWGQPHTACRQPGQESHVGLATPRFSFPRGLAPRLVFPQTRRQSPHTSTCLQLPGQHRFTVRCSSPGSGPPALPTHWSSLCSHHANGTPGKPLPRRTELAD